MSPPLLVFLVPFGGEVVDLKRSMSLTRVLETSFALSIVNSNKRVVKGVYIM